MKLGSIGIKFGSLAIPPFVMWAGFLWLYKPAAIGDTYPVTAVQISPSPTPSWPGREGLDWPELKTRSFAVMNYDTEEILTGKDYHRPLPPASTTKIMTAMVVMDFYSLNDVVTVPDSEVIGSKIEFEPGEKWTVDSLLQGLLIQSGNDAAMVLAENYPGGQQKFVEAMNRKAAELGLEETHFVNPSGLDDPIHLSSAYDLIRLARIAMKNERIAQLVATPVATINSVDEQVAHQLYSTNELLLTVPGVKGVKTGWTEEAGQSLVTLVERDGNSVLIAVLGSEDRFGDTKKLIDWLYE